MLSQRFLAGGDRPIGAAVHRARGLLPTIAEGPRTRKRSVQVGASTFARIGDPAEVRAPQRSRALAASARYGPGHGTHPAPSHERPATRGTLAAAAAGP